MNIRIIRRKRISKEVIAEMYGASSDELPKKDETIFIDGVEERVLSISMSFEKDTYFPIQPEDQTPEDKLDRICWFEVDIT